MRRTPRRRTRWRVPVPVGASAGASTGVPVGASVGNKTRGPVGCANHDDRRKLPEVLHYTAFSADPKGGNPAGVVLDASGLGDADMLAIAAEAGHSESVFLTAPPEGLGEPGRAFAVRYFSPLAEVPFCGHATIAAAVALGERIGPGDLVFATRAGEVPVSVTERDGVPHATLTSVEPYVEEADAGDVAEALAALDWPAGTWTRRCRRASPSRAPGTWCSRRAHGSGWPAWTTTSSG